MKKSGFTLIELLIVIGIIALLLAIMIPVTQTAKNCAKRVVCLSNQRQLTLAWTLYANDNNNYLCSPCPKWYGEDQEYSWIFWDSSWPWPKDWTRIQWEESIKKGALWDYNEKGTGVYSCPTSLENEFITYAGFGSMGWKESLNRPIEGETYQKISEIPMPGKRAVFIDEGRLTPQFFGVYYNIEAWFDQPPGRHLLGTTMSFADSHAEYWEWQDYRTREICQMDFDEYLITWCGVPCLNNNDLFKMKIAAWGSDK